MLSVCFLIGDVLRAAACPYGTLRTLPFVHTVRSAAVHFAWFYAVNRDYFLRQNLSVGPYNADTLRLLCGGVDNCKEYIS